LNDQSEVEVWTSELPTGARGHILVVEDDPLVGELLARVLSSAGYYVRLAGTGAAARAAVEDARPDLIVLDLILPDEDGLVLCTLLKAQTRAPILICSATRRARDEQLSTRLGADDFLAKPFEISQLTARVEGLLQRAAPPMAPASDVPAPLRVADLWVDPTTGQAALAGAPLQLTPTELRLLTALAQHRRGAVLGREALVRLVWGDSADAGSRAVDVHIGRLRAKLAQVRTARLEILSVRGIGYRLQWPSRDQIETEQPWLMAGEARPDLTSA
jgi:DNA-binding response OmpR family regulator